ncbi:hypothetical protein PVK06_020654 [Gossypium arboreum]|uniref:Uncharacterized protein n=1 Tax=Gossypium arboreum TaxID=29729 RepID=A0ABR0PMX7_GOSAR|nr:hypothetical protein PVK06_020654 [Gossypium arboreum]
MLLIFVFQVSGCLIRPETCHHLPQEASRSSLLFGQESSPFRSSTGLKWWILRRRFRAFQGYHGSIQLLILVLRPRLYHYRSYDIRKGFIASRVLPMVNSTDSLVDFNNPLYLHPSDTLGALLVSHHFYGIKNYSVWRRSVWITLFAKN